MNLHVGTSGYSYKEWKGNFYPEDLPAKEMLAAVERLREQNPMMGLRGVRLGIHMPDLVRMQVKAIFEAAQISANSAFSARNPYPGWIASAPVISAAAMILGMFRYDSRAGGGPMQTSSSANRTCSDSRSASE